MNSDGVITGAPKKWPKIFMGLPGVKFHPEISGVTLAEVWVPY